MSIKKMSLVSLLKIRDRNYKGVFGKEYDKKAIDAEIKRKTESKGFRGFAKVRKY